MENFIRYREIIGRISAKTDTEIEVELQRGSESSQEIKREELEQRNSQLKNLFQHRRVKRWNKI